MIVLFACVALGLPVLAVLFFLDISSLTSTSKRCSHCGEDIQLGHDIRWGLTPSEWDDVKSRVRSHFAAH